MNGQPLARLARRLIMATLRLDALRGYDKSPETVYPLDLISRDVQRSSKWHERESDPDGTPQEIPTCVVLRFSN